MPSALADNGVGVGQVTLDLFGVEIQGGMERQTRRHRGRRGGSGQTHDALKIILYALDRSKAQPVSDSGQLLVHRLLESFEHQRRRAVGVQPQQHERGCEHRRRFIPVEPIGEQRVDLVSGPEQRVHV